MRGREVIHNLFPKFQMRHDEGFSLKGLRLSDEGGDTYLIYKYCWPNNNNVIKLKVELAKHFWGSQHMKQYFESSDLSYTFFKSSTLSSDLQMLKFGSSNLQS